MQSEDFSIENRVANSALETFNLEDHYPIGQRTTLDLSQWLFEGFILREKDFRAALKTHDWSQYQDQYLALFCSTDAIVPAWAYILVTAQLGPYVKTVVVGDLEALESHLYQAAMAQIDWSSLPRQSRHYQRLQPKTRSQKRLPLGHDRPPKSSQKRHVRRSLLCSAIVQAKKINTLKAIGHI